MNSTSRITFLIGGLLLAATAALLLRGIAPEIIRYLRIRRM